MSRYQFFHPDIRVPAFNDLSPPPHAVILHTHAVNPEPVEGRDVGGFAIMLLDSVGLVVSQSALRQAQDDSM